MAPKKAVGERRSNRGMGGADDQGAKDAGAQQELQETLTAGKVSLVEVERENSST